MLKTLGRKLMNNIGLKLLALFLAVALWMVVVNIDDPSVRKSMTISVSLKNQDYITEMGKYLDILGESNTVTFYYTTKRSVWEGISGTDFSATADLEKIEAKENGGYRVPVTVTAIRNTNQITIETKQMYLDVALEDLGKKQFQIKANTSGTVIDGCALGVVEIESTNVVQVSGPVSVVNAIDSVVATVNVDGMATDITDNVVPVFYDANGEVLDTTKLEKSVETVKISAQILNTKDVPLSLSATGTPAEDYTLAEISSNPVSVRVKGTAAILNTLDKIVIPEEVLDISDASSDIEKTIDISTYLPSGVSLVISSDAKVNITAKIEKIDTKEYRVPVANITANGLKSGYQLTYTDSYVVMNITAGKTALNELKATDIKGVILVGNMSEGTHTVLVDFDLDSDIYEVSEAYVEVEIIKVSNESDSEENNSESNSESTEKTEESTEDEETPDDSVETGTNNSGGTDEKEETNTETTDKEQTNTETSSESGATKNSEKSENE